MALMPAPGDVDCVLASELAEAGRAVQRGLVTPDRTTLIASTHRSYAIGEKSAMGRGAVDSKQLAELLRSHAKRLVLFDMEETAERNHSVISSVLLGALCGSGELPFRRQTFEEEIKRSGIAVKANLAAFEDAYQRAQRGDGGFTGAATPKLRTEVPTQARSARLQPLLDRVRRLPTAVQPVVLEGARRAIDYQDPAYASLYLDRVERIAALETRPAAEARPAAGTRSAAEAVSYALLESSARNLALWMTFEDTIRVADLKTRAARFERVREEIRAAPGQIFGITEFMKPRVEEIAGTLPAGLGRRLLASPRLCGWLRRRTSGRQIRTGTVGGFLLLHTVGGLRRWRRSTLRFHEENARIEAWLGRIERLAATHYSLAVELARAQRLVKGYGDTHARGWRHFSALVEQLELLATRSDGALWLSRLQDAALADEEGQALARELAALSALAAPPAVDSESVVAGAPHPVERQLHP
jgi:indolepyruvate ferredoxin oxidoreductase beta subunit